MSDDSGACTWQKNNELLKSSVVVIFGKKGYSDKRTLPIEYGQDGAGVVVNDNVTVETAAHVYLARPSDTDTVFVMTYDGTWVEYDYDDVHVGIGSGDIVTITFPSGLPESVVPAQKNHNYDYLKGGQSVVVVHSTRTYNDKGQQTGYTLNFMVTTTYGVDLNKGLNAYQHIIKNSGGVLRKGDSGGPVFFNNQLIGVNAGVNGDVASVTPLCYQQKTWWQGLLGSPLKVCGMP